MIAVWYNKVYHSNVFFGAKLVVLNSIIVSLVFAGLLLVRFLFKKKIPLVLLLIIISTLPVLSVFRQGVYESGDFTLHIYRAMSFYSNLSEGQLMPSWAGELNAGYGYPLFLYLNPLSYYFLSFFHFLGFSFVISMKLYLLLFMILSAVSSYILGKDLFKDKLGAFAFSIFYIFTPYRLIDLHFRTDVGENLAFALAPILFLFIRKKSLSLFNFLMLTTLFSLLVITHQAIAIFSFFVLVPYIIFLSYKNKKIIKEPFFKFTAIFLGALVSSYVWIPYLFHKSYNFSSILYKVIVDFPNTPYLFFSPHRFGLLFQGSSGELYPFIGYLQLLVVILSLVLVLRKRIKKIHPEYWFWVFMFLFLLFLLTPYSQPLWYSLPVVRAGSIAFRLFLFMSLVTAFFGAFIVTNIKSKRIIYLLLFLTIFSTFINWGNRKMIPDINDSVLKNKLWVATYEGEGHEFLGQPKWIGKNRYWMNKLPKDEFKVIKGDAKIEIKETKNTKHLLIVNAKNKAEILDTTWYYPGWNLKVNNKPSPIEYSNPNYPGQITFSLPEGKNSVEIYYKDELLMSLAKKFFLFYFLIVILYLVVRKRKLGLPKF